ncbi:mannitol 1-phosphate dehydrogenase [Podospora conica]|nr:mannitol 1-phosphate dehydrogenase [Schizothecium conicum]
MSQTPTPPPSIAIIGGGLGGVVLAIGLLHRNIPFHLYESAPSFGEIGAGVTIGANAVRALSQLSPSLLAAFTKHMTCNATTPSSFLAFRHGVPSPSHRTPLPLIFDLLNHESAATWTATPTRMAVHRAHFLDEIIRFIPATHVSFNKTLISLTQSPDTDVVTLTFSDATTATHPLVLAADGIKSTARRFVHPPTLTPTFAGEYAYRALVPSSVFRAAMATDDADTLTRNGQLYLGRDGVIITYPVSHGASVNMVGIRRAPSSVWPHGEQWLVPATKGEMEADFAGWDSRLVGLLGEYGTRDRWGLFHYRHGERYWKGRVGLLGDAAHATTPHLGAGAGQAMEDAVVLAGLVEEVGRLRGREGMWEGEAVGAVLEAYDAVRRGRSQEVVGLSSRCGRTYGLREEGVGEDFGEMRRVMGERLRWLLDVDLEGEVERARAKLRVKLGSGSKL